MSLQGDGRNMTLDPKNDDYWGHKIYHVPIFKIVSILHQHQIHLLIHLRLPVYQKINGKLPNMTTKILKIEEG